MLMPLLPAAVVVIGFHGWRRLCPVATLGSIGTRSWRGRRLPAALRNEFFAIPFALLVGALVLRHVWMNGDGVALALFLAGFVLAAFAVNAVFGGKTWCNYFCPVGFIERVYTDAAPRGPEHSRCGACTGCRAACPDIDQERAYRRERSTRSRRLSTYAFPGIVWGFYAYFWLREGDFGGFFGGAWVSRPASATLAFGTGLSFLPEVPALVAVGLTLALFGLVSACAFLGLERLLVMRFRDRERAEHFSLSAAAFVAFSVFYFFAGAPALREHPMLAWPVRFGLGVTLAVWVAWRRIKAPVGERLRSPSRPVRRLLVVPGG
jgi:polyferredoxin